MGARTLPRADPEPFTRLGTEDFEATVVAFPVKFICSTLEAAGRPARTSPSLAVRRHPVLLAVVALSSGVALSCKGTSLSTSPSADLTTYLPWPVPRFRVTRAWNGLDPSMLRFLQMSQLWATACLPALPFQSAPIGGYARNSNLAGSHATWSGSL